MRCIHQNFTNHSIHTNRNPGNTSRINGMLYCATRLFVGCRVKTNNPSQHAQSGSARLGSVRLGSARLGSARIGSARVGWVCNVTVSFYNPGSFSKPNRFFWAFSLNETQNSSCAVRQGWKFVFYLYRNRSSLEENRYTTYYSLLLFDYKLMLTDHDVTLSLPSTYSHDHDCFANRLCIFRKLLILILFKQFQCRSL